MRRFLACYSPLTRLHPEGDARAFLAELHRRHTSKYPSRTPQTTTIPAGYVAPPEEPEERAVFLSYAREDLVATRLLYAALRAAGVPAWFDEKALQVGDVWERKILIAIESAPLVVPVVTRAIHDKNPRFFRREWTLAARRADFYGPGRPYLLPLFIDPAVQASAEAPVPDAFFNKHIVRLNYDPVSGSFEASALREWAESVRTCLRAAL